MTFTDYKVEDLVRVTPIEGEPYEARVFGNVSGLSVVREGDLHARHVSYERVEMIEPNPQWPVETR